jgi:hypothetical protein
VSEISFESLYLVIILVKPNQILLHSLRRGDVFLDYFSLCLSRSCSIVNMLFTQDLPLLNRFVLRSVRVHTLHLFFLR